MTAFSQNTPPGHDDSGNHMPAAPDKHLDFERLISDLSARFVNIAPDKIDAEIEAALKQVLEFFQVDRCVFLGISPDGKKVHVTHAAYSEGTGRVSGDIDLATLFPWIYERLVLQGLTVDIAGIEDLPEKAGQDRASCTAMGIRSFLDIPLFFEGSLASIIVLNSVRQHRSWPNEYIPRLRLLGEIFINALERRNADLALRESEARLSLATEAVGAGLWIMDVDNSRVWVSPKSRELFHFGPDEEIHYESYFRVIHPDDRDRVHQDVQRTLRSGENLNCDYRIVLPDGSIRWIVSRGQRFLKSTGEPDRIMGLSLDITERKLREAAEIESTERYQAVVEAFDGFIYICSPDYRMEFMNQRLIERTGRNAVGEMCYKALHDRDSICEWCVNDRVFQGETVRWEVQSPKDQRWYYVANTPVRHADGTISKQSMIMDITERKRAEEALEESRTQIAAIMNSTEDFIWSVDVKRFGLTTFNAALRNYFFRGRGIEISLGMAPEDMLPPDYAAKWHEFYQRALQEGPFVIEYFTSAKTHVLLLSINLLKRDGEVFGISVLGKDITDLKRAEQEIRRSEERFRQVAENVGDVIWEVDANGLYRYMSPAVEKVLGYNPDELIGKMHFYDLFAPEVREELKAAAFQVLAAKKSFRAFSNANMSKDGKIVHLETSGVPVLDEFGNLVGYRGSDTDVTERKRAEEELKESEEALRKSQKYLQKLAGRLISAQEEELRRLSRELHDDLTQRLAVLAIEADKLELELNKKTEACPEISQKISQMKEQLISVSEDVHAISRQLHPTILDDLGLVRAIESTCVMLMKQENIEIAFAKADVPALIPKDTALCLYRIVQEGLRNIIRHSHARDAEIFLKGTDSSVCLTIRDAGIGFDPAEVRQQPGLGLASMRERVGLVGGDFSITSQPGKGTVIRVCVSVTAGDV